MRSLRLSLAVTEEEIMSTPVSHITKRGYGPVNGWAHIKSSQFTKMLDWMVACQTGTLLIEMQGWSERSWVGKQSEMHRRFADVVGDTRSRGLWIFDNIVNANDKKAMAMPDSWFYRNVDFIASLGPSHMIVQGLSEWKANAKTLRWIKYVEATLGPLGFDLSWNQGSRPTGINPKYGNNALYNHLDWHIFRLGNMPPRGDPRFEINTDTSTMLRWLHNGPREAQKMVPGRVIQFAQQVFPLGYGCWLYGFWHKTPDFGAIEALGKA